jgi:hypothetical protein
MKYAIYIILPIFLAGCEVFTIGSPAPVVEVIDINQETPVGAVYLFKAELDSNNVPGASLVLADHNGRPYLAFERYEMYFEIDRIKRLTIGKPVTAVKTDTISSNTFRVNLELDYIWKFTAQTAKINDRWYITNYNYIRMTF